MFCRDMCSSILFTIYVNIQGWEKHGFCRRGKKTPTFFGFPVEAAAVFFQRVNRNANYSAAAVVFWAVVGQIPLGIFPEGGQTALKRWQKKAQKLAGFASGSPEKFYLRLGFA
ncbi:hypothetical protein B9Z55_026585 [Caenorhabditis nigoni]|uniref:Uncharacterized protein n=1 Tax=Caenorhabditis nigoni TaxID=1611254 RepID=A0A2G5T3T8_9PELO|nr:hypothetical protein B9Z55_026585 [Caenorhabditis nigoni]